MLQTILLLCASPVDAHQPHDPVYGWDASPVFASDGFVITTRAPGQNWDSAEIATSTSGGILWTQAMRGIGNAAELSDVRLSPTFDADGIAIVASEGEGVWITADGAATWRSSLPGLDIARVVVAHDSASAILIAVETGGKVWRSTDLGAHWSSVLQLGAPTGLAALGPEIAIAADGAIQHSTDGGVSWSELPVGLEIEDVAVAPGAVLIGTLEGAALSTDGSEFLPVFPGQQVDAVGIAPGWPADPYLVACTHTECPFVSTDGGQSFTPYNTGMALSDQSERHFYGFRFSGTFHDDHTLFLGSFEGLTKSTDSGATWHELDTRPPGMVLGIGMSPDFATDGTVLATSLDQGMWVSTDGGITWNVRNTGLPGGSAYDVDLAHDATGAVVAMVAQNGQMTFAGPPFDEWSHLPVPPPITYTSRCAFSPDYATDHVAIMATREGGDGMWRSTDQGVTWVNSSVPLGAVTAVSFGADSSTILAGVNDGTILLSTDGGITFSFVPGIPVMQQEVWIAGNSLGFLVGTGAGLFTSTDGRTFVPVVEVPGVIQAVATSDDGTRFAQVRGGGLFRSDDGGPFLEVGQALTAIGSPQEIEVSPTLDVDGTVLAAIDERMFRSTDRGETWTQVGMNWIRYEQDVQAVEPHLHMLHAESTHDDASCEDVASVDEGSFAELTFWGDGVAVLGATADDLGEADVTLDGAVVDHISQTAPEAWQVEHYRVEGLPLGVHQIRLDVTSGTVLLDAFDVFRGDLGTGPVDTGPGDTDLPGETGTGGDTETHGGGDDRSCGCNDGPGGAPWIAVAAAATLLRRRRRVAW